MYKIKLIIIFFLFLSFLNLSGCSTFISKAREDVPQTGHLYSGVTQNASFWKCVVVGYPEQFNKDKGSVFMIPIAATLLTFDTATSLVADTLFIPIDLLQSSVNERSSIDELIAMDCE